MLPPGLTLKRRSEVVWKSDRDTVLGIAVAVLMLAAYALVGSIEYQDEVASKVQSEVVDEEEVWGYGFE